MSKQRSKLFAWNNKQNKAWFPIISCEVTNDLEHYLLDKKFFEQTVILIHMFSNLSPNSYDDADGLDSKSMPCIIIQSEWIQSGFIHL